MQPTTTRPSGAGLCEPSTLCTIVGVIGMVALVAIGIALLAMSNKNVGPAGTAGGGKKPLPSNYKETRYAAVTSDSKFCSTIGTNVLAVRKGSAIDAAIATYLCNCLVMAQACGIGGGFFATVYETPNNATNTSMKELMTIVARERAPLWATANMYANGASSQYGGLSIAVPGEVYGYYQLWLRYGRLPWKSLFTDAIRICQEGFPIERPLADALTAFNATLWLDPNFRSLFFWPMTGKLKQIGDLLVNPELAVTLQAIADDPMTFYTGALAQKIVADIADYGGNISTADLAAYRTTFSPPVTTYIRNGDFTMNNNHPPSSGVILDFMMNILDGYNFTNADISTTDRTILTYHRIIETFKFAFAKRSQLGDENFVNVSGLIASLTSKAYAESIRRQITDDRTQPLIYYGPTFDVITDHGTSQLNVLTPDGAAFSATSTINTIMGAFVRGKRTGIIFNNQMDNFAKPGTVNLWGVIASPSNYIEPGKAPQSSTCPTILTDSTGQVEYLTGGAGGPTITTTTAWTLIHRVFLGLSLPAATDAPRCHHQLLPNQVQYEDWLDPAIVAGLAAKGHVMVPWTLASEIRGLGVNSVETNCPDYIQTATNSCITMVCDGRREGIPDGF